MFRSPSDGFNCSISRSRSPTFQTHDVKFKSESPSVGIFIPLISTFTHCVRLKLTSSFLLLIVLISTASAAEESNSTEVLNSITTAFVPPTETTVTLSVTNITVRPKKKILDSTEPPKERSTSIFVSTTVGPIKNAVRDRVNKPENWLFVNSEENSKTGDLKSADSTEQPKPSTATKREENSVELNGFSQTSNHTEESVIAPLTTAEFEATQKNETSTTSTVKVRDSSESETADQTAERSENGTTNVVSKGGKMLLVEQHALDLVPLEDLLNAMLFALAATFMVVGGAIPYVFQYVEIYRRKSALGFSLLVCLALCVANILRILFWFGKRFETVLLVQSIVMIGCMLLMLEISVRMNKKMLPASQRKSIWKGDFVNAFWKWNDLSSFVAALAIFTVIASIVTFFFTRFPIYVEALGMVALLVEACLGLPQLIRNFQRRSTQGMSVNMVLMWLLGDIGKTVYFVVRKNPAQFWICSSLQITIDILILGQVYFFNRGAARVPTYVPRMADDKAGV
ncbi:PQ-loop repeat-containing protein 1 [Aphelenchoides besseyi]|nr:PQ-loop repeat-containing protein 1 [Aphelenchoides besseyi]